MAARIQIVDGARDPLAHPDLGTIDALARLQLEAARQGICLRLVNPSTELCELLELAGLAGLFVLEPRSGPESPRRTERPKAHQGD